MKTLILASFFCAALRAQSPQPNIGVWHVVQNLQNTSKHQPMIARFAMPSGVNNLPNKFCSVPLLEGNPTINDPGIVVAPKDHSAEIRKAHVPAPPCPKP